MASQSPSPLSRRTAQAVAVSSATVGVVVNTVGGYSRGVLRGITTFAAARAWTLRVVGVNENEIDTSGRKWQGIVVQASTPEQAARFRSLPIPAVNISSSVADSGLPTVITDDAAVGRLGADHFVRSGYRTLAFYAPDSRAFSISRHQGFSRRTAEAALTTVHLADAAALDEALRSLPKPLAIMGCNDRAALAVLDACRSLSLKVPDDVAVLGVDDDDLVQALAYPPLSTVNTARDRVGFEAAALLDELMSSHQKTPVERPKTLLVSPKGLVTRRSTDATALADPDVAEAARFIHAHSGRPISVEDVVAAVALSRRQLERRFQLALGRSILDEIIRCRIHRARQLLIDTELTLEQVAFASGFASASYFSVVFKRETQSTPQQFRSAYRVPGAI